MPECRKIRGAITVTRADDLPPRVWEARDLNFLDEPKTVLDQRAASGLSLPQELDEAHRVWAFICVLAFDCHVAIEHRR